MIATSIPVFTETFPTDAALSSIVTVSFASAALQDTSPAVPATFSLTLDFPAPDAKETPFARLAPFATLTSAFFTSVPKETAPFTVPRTSSFIRFMTPPFAPSGFVKEMPLTEAFLSTIICGFGAEIFSVFPRAFSVHVSVAISLISTDLNTASFTMVFSGASTIRSMLR